MNKIILLDWDGPISNSRTCKMPGFVDPVAIQMLNDLTAKGWKTVLTSTIRKHFEGEAALAEATKFMNSVGFNVQWYHNWRTDPGFTTRRPIEVANWLMTSDDIPEDAVFLIVDDEHFPKEMLERGRMSQIYASSHAGIDYLSISEAYYILGLSEEKLEEHFAVKEE